MENEKKYQFNKTFSVKREENLYTIENKMVRSFTVYGGPAEHEIPDNVEDHQIEEMKVSINVIHAGNERDFKNSICAAVARVLYMTANHHADEVTEYALQLGQGDRVEFSVFYNDDHVIRRMKCNQYIVVNDVRDAADSRDNTR